MSRLIEPWIARSVARRVAGDDVLKGSPELERLQQDLDIAVPRSETLVGEASGIPAPSPVRWGIINRSQWADANITGMIALMAPLADKIGERLDQSSAPVRTAQRGIVSVEVGALLGYISRRVLGQYDLLVPGADNAKTRAFSRRVGMRSTAESDDGALYFVGPNMIEMEKKFGFIPDEFALWVALHEVTHRFQFAGVPWLRERFLDLVHTYLGSIEMNAKGLAERLAAAGTKLVSRALAPEERNPMYLLASDDQRKILDQMQALMAVVEGHGNFVMDSVGARVIPSFGRMRELFEGRRAQTTAIQRAINHVIGLEMKLRQYELGQKFCNEVVQRAGMTVLSHLWDAPENLPTLDELRTPALWLTRVA
ncbi:MAG: hypothetical protein QOD46_233 [Actinomycetota bacterium]|jgi:coenzyme F420 biosynthesis associated uncharacterized protein|nr:hypothetical protein [Actinomycetota bacterium]